RQSLAPRARQTAAVARGLGADRAVGRARRRRLVVAAGLRRGGSRRGGRRGLRGRGALRVRGARDLGSARDSSRLAIADRARGGAFVESRRATPATRAYPFGARVLRSGRGRGSARGEGVAACEPRSDLRNVPRD